MKLYLDAIGRQHTRETKRLAAAVRIAGATDQGFRKALKKLDDE